MLREADLANIIEQPIMTEYILSSNEPGMFIKIDHKPVYNKCLNFKQQNISNGHVELCKKSVF